MEESKTKQRTRKTILQTFWTLLLEKKFEELLVNDICEKAMITRATFYKYFQDKYQLADFALSDLHKRIFDVQLEKVKFKSAKELYMKFVEICIEYIDKHRQSFQLFVKHGYTGKLRTLFLQSINDYIEASIKKRAIEFKFNTPPEITSKFITGGFVFSLFFMIENPSDYSKTELIKYARDILDAMIK